ncbi:MAG: 4Fe-4S dicluster domain-containing protein [Euryarchaeota archaeon]|nr:4Fe-4S dicluster domain-containing protein [Euryarchaeota archaeon]
MTQKKYERKAVVKILEDRCKGCWYCVNYCPTKVLVISDKMNAKGYHPPEFREDKEHVCIACHLCELYCPDFAIFVEELK